MLTAEGSRWPRALLRTVVSWVLLLVGVGLVSTGCGSGEDLSCAAPLTECNGVCVNLSIDPQYCGQCTTSCAAGELCEQGMCSNPCGAGQGSCNGECVSLMSDPRYCGRCDVACADGQFCTAGSCASQCDYDICTTFSGTVCADLTSNALHCGECGRACESQFACAGGTCSLVCDAPLTACNNAECVDLQSNDAHCGMCNTVCPMGSTCQTGSCQCAEPYLLCGLACVDVSSDAEHCGGCDTPCQAGYVCNGGSCECPADRMLCGDQCADLMTDALHCGSCDISCQGEEMCDAGRCVGADGCGGLAADISVTQVAVYQTVKIPIVENGQAVAVNARNADVVVDREAIFRVFADLESGFASRELSARIRFTDGAETTEYFAKATLTQSSTDDDVASTFNIEVPREAITTGARYSVQIVECAEGAQGTPASPTFPAQGEVELSARVTGPLKIHLLPFVYGGLLPDTSPAQLAYYKAFFEAMYPITEAQLTVGDPLDAGGFSDLGVTLEQTFAVRDAEGPDDDVYYYGIARPANTLEQFCQGTCTLGVGFVADPGASDFRAAVGVAFGEESQIAGETLLHEVGHNHGREHAPCGDADDVDPVYPHAGGLVGVWGYDPRDGSLLPPDLADIMGYCNPQWISDYTYQALLERVVELNVPVQQRIASASVLAPLPAFRVLHVDDQHSPRWSRPYQGRLPSVVPEAAAILNEQGQLLTTVNVYRVPMHGVNAAMVLVPEPQPGWYAVQVAGSVAQPFAAPIEIMVP